MTNCEERAIAKGRGKPAYLGGTRPGLGAAVRLLVPSGSPRAFSPRDDKVCGEGHAGSGIGYTTRSLSLRGGSGARDAAIHRVSREGDRVLRFAYWSPVDRHGLRPRDDKTGKTEYYEWTLKKLKRICPKYFAF